jgi:hypothetical protein
VRRFNPARLGKEPCWPILLTLVAAGWAGTSVSGAVADRASLTPIQVQARLGIGDLRPLEALNDRAAMPILADLLAAAEEGAYRQHSGGIRGAIIQQMARIDGAAEALGGEIERRSERDERASVAGSGTRVEETTAVSREDLMDALSALNTSAARAQLGRFLFDGRTGYARGVDGPVSNSMLAARSLGQMAWPDFPVPPETDVLGLEELRKVQDWWRTRETRVQVLAPKLSIDPQPALEPRVPGQARLFSREAVEEHKDTPVEGALLAPQPAESGAVGWTLIAGGLFGAAVSLPLLFRRELRVLR